MLNGVEVCFITNHKMVNSSITRQIEVKLIVPKYYPTGVKLNGDDTKQYILDHYGFEVIGWKTKLM